MIADAAKIALPDSTKHSVDLQTIRLTDPKRGLRYTYLTPRIAQEALVRWDMGIKPTPFSFVLRGGQVTRAFKRKAKETDPKKLAQRQRNAQKMVALNKARLSARNRSNHSVPDRVGGKTPPLGRDKHDVPYSRRREFGIRGLTFESKA